MAEARGRVNDCVFLSIITAFSDTYECVGGRERGRKGKREGGDEGKRMGERERGGEGGRIRKRVRGREEGRVCVCVCVCVCTVKKRVA